jgi:dihydroxyacetone kinase
MNQYRSQVNQGMGIHNEPGHRRLRPFRSLDNVVEEMMELITSTSDTERSFLTFKGEGLDEVVLLVNNLGGTSDLEMGAVAGAGGLLPWCMLRYIDPYSHSCEMVAKS